MVWCITICSYEVDVDLLFQENSHIGQKIALTEKIVGALKIMKCPYRIEPHQIQGLDFIHIYPVVQWLVKRAIETREEMGDYIRAYSISQFSKHYSLPEDIAFSEKKERAVDTVNTVKTAYRPQRKFRRQDADKLRDEELRVQSTLLEYGRRYGLGTNTSADEDSKKKVTDAEREAEEKSLEEEEKRIEALMKGMSITKGQEGKLTASSVGTLVGLQSDKIQQIAAEFAEKQAEIGQMDKSLGGAQHHQRLTAALKRQTEQQEAKINEVEPRHTELKQTFIEIRNKTRETEAVGEALDSEIQKMIKIEEESGQKHLLNDLHNLMTLAENLKKQEAEFRENCKKEKDRLESEINEIKVTQGLTGSQGAVQRVKSEHDIAVEEQYESHREKLRKIRLLVAKKNREIATLQRKIDEVPTRAELSQYQQRFVELYNQVTSKHKETKQFYTLYNTLEDTRVYLTKEVTLLNSINDTFEQAMGSANTKDQFLKQFEQIVDGVKQNRTKVEKRKQEEKMKRDQLNDSYLALIEKQRQYFKTVKDFQEECRKNEILQSKLQQSGS
jgi:DNA repair exonuclease SbcCD ATPase subunit